MTVLRVVALTAACAHALAPRQLDRRRCLGLGLPALAALAPLTARAASDPTQDELRKLTLGYARMQTLLKDWTKITGGSCGNAQLTKDKAQVVATNGGALCDASPLVIQEYIGYKSINDPLYRSEKLMVRAAPLLKNPDDIDAYLEAVNLWGQKIQMSSLNAYTSAWGEANPNGSKAAVAAYMQDARYDVEESADLLKRILVLLGLPLTA